MTTDQIDPLLTAKQVAAIFNVSPSFVRSHANGTRRPQIPAVKLGGVVRFRRSSIVRLIEELEREVANGTN